MASLADLISQFGRTDFSPEEMSARNAPYVRQGAQPMLTPQGVNEPGFQQWLAQNRVPFDPGQSADYDMRGFYNALMRNDPRAATAVNTNDQQLHFPDYWKMPTHQSFSGESQWAGPMAPQWINDSQLASPGGRILFDEKALARLRSGDYRRR